MPIWRLRIDIGQTLFSVVVSATWGRFVLLEARSSFNWLLGILAACSQGWLASGCESDCVIDFDSARGRRFQTWMDPGLWRLPLLRWDTILLLQAIVDLEICYVRVVLLNWLLLVFVSHLNIASQARRLLNCSLVSVDFLGKSQLVFINEWTGYFLCRIVVAFWLIIGLVGEWLPELALGRGGWTNHLYSLKNKIK